MIRIRSEELGDEKQEKEERIYREHRQEGKKE
jgi:hypothetical protein